MGVRVTIVVVLVMVMIISPLAWAEEPNQLDAARYVPITTSEHVETEVSVVVAPGDHLWKISARAVGGTGADIASYWVGVVDANRVGLRSGDPDLIYPGEIILLPQVPIDEQ